MSTFDHAWPCDPGWLHDAPHPQAHGCGNETETAPTDETETT